MSKHGQKPPIEDIIESLHVMREVCSRYGKKYHMLSEHFYELYSQGLLDDFERLNYDFVDWAGSYKTALEYERRYNDSYKDTPVNEKLAQIKSYALAA